MKVQVMKPRFKPENHNSFILYPYHIFYIRLHYKRLGMKDKIFNYFGYSDRIIDNILTPADRDVFYTLEELEIVKPMEEEITISKGKLWRIHYWVYRKDKIQEILEEEEKEEKGEESPEEIYAKLFQEIEKE